MAETKKKSKYNNSTMKLIFKLARNDFKKRKECVTTENYY